jgi:hypothetical protein
MGRCCWASESERERERGKKRDFLGFCALVMEKRDGEMEEREGERERGREKRERLKRV